MEKNKSRQSDRVKRVVREGLINKVTLGRLEEGGSKPQAMSLKVGGGGALSWTADCLHRTDPLT